MRKWVVVAVSLLFLTRAMGDEPTPRQLAGWGLDLRDPESFMARAAETGFEVLITSSTDAVLLGKAIEAGQRHGIEVFVCINPIGLARRLWSQHLPDQPVPWQVMTEQQEAAFSFINAGRNKYLIPYQWGGEPMLTHEVLVYRIVCMANRRMRSLFEPVLKEILAIPGVAGIALDGFGYQNYHRCHCDTCSSLLAAFLQENPQLTETEAEIAFFRNMLVAYVNGLLGDARRIRPEVKTLIHIWPVFAPEPLYGNRLDVDYCGQTAAWYTRWPEEKIEAYSRIIHAEAQRHHSRQIGVGMIGYYDKPEQFPVKDAQRVDRELHHMLSNGITHVQVCGTGDVLDNPEITSVFKRYFGPPEQTAAQTDPHPAGEPATAPDGRQSR